MRFLQIHQPHILWSITQNVLVIMLFVSAVWYWAREKRIRSMTCTLAGALVSSLLVRSTKPMASDYNEPYEITIVTMISMSVLQALLVTYLGTEAEWSNWRVDLGLGSMAGISLAVGQGLASQGPPWIRTVLHGLALAATGVVVLLTIRKLKEQTLLSALASTLLLTVMMTVIGRAMGYRLILE
jgi:hypothetical protein